jgi:hypothetical protein
MCDVWTIGTNKLLIMETGPRGQAKLGKEKGGSTASPRRWGGSLSRERDRDGLICEVLQRLAAQLCMNVIYCSRFVILS